MKLNEAKRADLGFYETAIDAVNRAHPADGGPTLTAMGDDATEFLPPDTAPASLAWSDADTAEEPGRASWRSTWGRSAAVLAVCLMAAALVVLGWRDLSVPPERASAPRSETPAATQTTTISPAPAVAPPLPATTGSVAEKLTIPPAALDPDSIYLQLLSDAGVKAPTREKAIANGHLICQQLAQGSTVDDVKAEVNRVNPSLGVNRSNGTVYAAIVAYCPQYDNRGER